MSARVGETFVAGMSRDNARALLSAAERLDHDPFVVRTVDGGFIVPTEVAEEAATAPPEQQQSPTYPADET